MPMIAYVSWMLRLYSLLLLLLLSKMFNNHSQHDTICLYFIFTERSVMAWWSISPDAGRFRFVFNSNFFFLFLDMDTNTRAYVLVSAWPNRNWQPEKKIGKQWQRTNEFVAKIENVMYGNGTIIITLQWCCYTIPNGTEGKNTKPLPPPTAAAATSPPPNWTSRK